MTAGAGVRVFGPIVTSTDVAVAGEQWLRWWLPSYLAELERRTSRTAGDLAMPFSWARKSRFDRQPPEQLPAAIIVSPGTAAKPSRAGDGTVSAWFRLEVAILMRGVDAADAQDKAGLYGAAIRSIALQHPSMQSDLYPAGFANTVELNGEGSDLVPADYLPIGAAVEVDMNVQVAEIGNAFAGPAAPTVPEPDDWPAVAAINDIHIDLEKES